MWGPDYVGDTKTLDVHIKRLRAKVEADPSNPTRIVTIRGLGYGVTSCPAPDPPPPVRWRGGGDNTRIRSRGERERTARAAESGQQR